MNWKIKSPNSSEYEFELNSNIFSLNWIRNFLNLIGFKYFKFESDPYYSFIYFEKKIA